MQGRRSSAGFTLVELLVALFAMAVLAVMSWRGLDGMTRAQAQMQARSDEVLTLQVGLAQWGADLDAVVELPGNPAIEWNGRVLRIARRSSTSPGEGIVVAAWSRRVVDGASTWLRWQSVPATTREQLAQSWQQADTWSQSSGDADRTREVAVGPLAEWQIFFFRGGAWTNPMSDATTQPQMLQQGGGAPPVPLNESVPDGVRLVLVLPPGQGISGTLTRDWVRPTLTRDRSA